MNLREQAEADLAVTLEDTEHGFGLPVELISPHTGTRYPVSGQVLYDSQGVTDAGLPIVIHRPVVTVRRSSLPEVPASGTKPSWACRIPNAPDPGAPLETYLVEEAQQTGGSLGFIRLYLTRGQQEATP